MVTMDLNDIGGSTYNHIYILCIIAHEKRSILKKIYSYLERCTVEALNEGRVGTSTDIHYSDVVLYWEVSAKTHLFHIVGHTKKNSMHYYSDS